MGRPRNVPHPTPQGVFHETYGFVSDCKCLGYHRDRPMFGSVGAQRQAQRKVTEESSKAAQIQKALQSRKTRETHRRAKEAEKGKGQKEQENFGGTAIGKKDARKNHQSWEEKSGFGWKSS
ncbi:hypothetical protein L6R29_14450 [Myxococcota bacterium]|nr:hypothetical protein [Myxococcota bacterium]